MRPEPQEGCQVSDWFNILVLHQNRFYLFLEMEFYLAWRVKFFILSCRSLSPMCFRCIWRCSINRFQCYFVLWSSDLSSMSFAGWKQILKMPSTSIFCHVFWTSLCGDMNTNVLLTLRCRWYSYFLVIEFVVVSHLWSFMKQEVPGMGFHITQPGSSVATSLIDGESKPKHVLLLEIKVVFGQFYMNRTGYNYCLISVWSNSCCFFFFNWFAELPHSASLVNLCTQGNQYRPTKIPLNSVRPFEYAEVS